MELEAFRRARLAEVAAEADRLLAEADASVASELEVARRTAEAVLSQARSDGAAEAEREMELARARGQRSARGIVLAARREAYQGLCERARATAFELRATPGYGALLDRVERLVRQQLGDDTRIERDPVDLGGVLAEAHGRRVDYSLAALVDRSVRGLGEEVEQLWT